MMQTSKHNELKTELQSDIKTMDNVSENNQISQFKEDVTLMNQR
jgi:hypothetical protein